MLKAAFNKIIEAENARASESKINVYECYGCARSTVTIDTDNGTTPFMISCPSCGKSARSSMYRVNQSLKPTHEFYRPPFEDLRKLSGGEQQHVIMGGLLFRKIEEKFSNQSSAQ